MGETTFAAIIGGIAGGATGGIFAIIGAYWGSIKAKIISLEAINASNKNAIDIMQRQEFNAAASKLRAAFAVTKTKLYLAGKSGDVNLREFFDNELPGHVAAIEKFRPFAGDRNAYQEALENYRKTIYEDDSLGDADLR